MREIARSEVGRGEEGAGGTHGKASRHGLPRFHFKDPAEIHQETSLRILDCCLRHDRRFAHVLMHEAEFWKTTDKGLRVEVDQEQTVGTHEAVLGLPGPKTQGPKAALNPATLAAAECYADLPPWAAGAVPHALAASGGSFSSPAEAVSGSFATGALSAGRHILYVRGQDSAGHWGPLSATFFTLGNPRGDFNADRKSDVLFRHSSSGEVRLWLMD